MSLQPFYYYLRYDGKKKKHYISPLTPYDEELQKLKGPEGKEKILKHRTYGKKEELLAKHGEPRFKGCIDASKTIVEDEQPLTPKQKGYLAAKKGYSEHTNPYKKGTYEYIEWLQHYIEGLE
jgi:hypothetical protein